LFALASLVLAAHVSVDVTANRHAVSDTIYGVTFATDAQVKALGLKLRRFGGNSYSRYNFQTQTTNEGGDNAWFRNRVLSDGGAEFADRFINATRDAGAAVMLELPVLGFVSKSGPGCGFSVAKYGPQRTVAPDNADCGDGWLLDGGRVTGNDPLDTSVPIDAGFVSTWVQWVNGRVAYYDLSNQPALWNSTHYDIHPQPSTYLEIYNRMAEATAVVKAVNPFAKTLGPSEWGWINYFDSAAGERTALGIDFVPYYLHQAAVLQTSRGMRQLDYLDLHVFPQAPTPNTTAIFSGDTSATTNALRLRSTRILWDPSYTVESWETCCFDQVQRIIPRMHDWIAAEYPGTGVSISSYGWGAYDHITGALAEADVLGIFGREGVDLATLEAPPFEGQLVEDAFRLYRNYDGAGATFGSTSVSASSDDVTHVTAYAAIRGQTVTVVLINKDPALTEQADVVFPSVSGGAWRAFGFSNGMRLTPTGAGTAMAGATITRVLAPYTAELLELVADNPLPTMQPDAGAPDAGASDAGQGDAGEMDAGAPDAGPPDAGATDSGTPGTPDSGTPTQDAGPTMDAGMTMPPMPKGCGCNASGAPLLLLALLAFSRRRRS
jgi:hypothetical protein